MGASQYHLEKPQRSAKTAAAAESGEYQLGYAQLPKVDGLTVADKRPLLEAGTEVGDAVRGASPSFRPLGQLRETFRCLRNTTLHARVLRVPTAVAQYYISYGRTEHHIEGKIHMVGQKNWANFRPIIGIFIQTTGPT